MNCSNSYSYMKFGTNIICKQPLCCAVAPLMHSPNSFLSTASSKEVKEVVLESCAVVTRWLVRSYARSWVFSVMQLLHCLAQSSWIPQIHSLEYWTWTCFWFFCSAILIWTENWFEIGVLSKYSSSGLSQAEGSSNMVAVPHNSCSKQAKSDCERAHSNIELYSLRKSTLYKVFRSIMLETILLTIFWGFNVLERVTWSCCDLVILHDVCT